MKARKNWITYAVFGVFLVGMFGGLDFAFASQDFNISKIELWQEYIDKYIMPNVMAIITGVGMVFAVFGRFKSIVETYKSDKEQFSAEKEAEFKMLGEEVAKVLECISETKTRTLDTIANMPIAKMESDIASSKEALQSEMVAIKDFNKMLEILLQVQRSMLETSYLPTEQKDKIRKLLWAGEDLASKKGVELDGVQEKVSQYLLDISVLQDDCESNEETKCGEEQA